MEFLSAAAVREREDEVRRVLETLLASRAVVGKPGADQWRFLAACLERVLRPESASNLDGLSPARAAQLKFEAHDRLRRFYRRRDDDRALSFFLVHRAELERYRIADAPGYPSLSGYCLLVHDPELDATLLRDNRLVDGYVERVVTEAVDAEFGTYMALPALDPSRLNPWFVVDGPAFREIVERAAQRRAQEWVLSNPTNPSTKRILSLDVRREGEDEALVRSTEYWYLRWWSRRLGDYVYAYRETSRPVYVVKRFEDEWRVLQTLRKAPHALAQNRRGEGSVR